MKKGRIIRLAILFFILSLLCSLLLVSCTPKKSIIGTVMTVYCPYSTDLYCYRNAAVQGSNAAWCEKIEQSTNEKTLKTNFIKDTCYMMVAIQTNDKAICTKITGTDTIYSKQECLNSIQ